MKMRRMFLMGTLFGVILAATFTFFFAIPANNYHWQRAIWERGGGAFTMDMKTGHTGWKWLVEPIRDTPRHKPVMTQPSAVKVRSEQL